MRTIDADDAINRIRRLWTDDIPPEDRYDRDEYARGLIDAIDAVEDSPTVEREPGEWIPCSERLPINGHYYLWCSDMGNVQSDYYWDGFEDGTKYGYNIVAWMPLPKPWEGAAND